MREVAEPKAPRDCEGRGLYSRPYGNINQLIRRLLPD